MANRIIIVGTKRGQENVPVSDLLQMKGRCARKHGQNGVVDFIVNENEVAQLQDDLKNSEKLEIDSTMCKMETLSFHLCAEISLGNIKTVEDINKWYKRSFAFQVGYEIEIDKVIKNMVKNGYIEECNGSINPTALSDISLKCYFYPNTIVAWRNNFKVIFDSQLEDNVFAISWALANVPNIPIKYNIFKRQDVLEEYNDNINSLKLDNEKSLAGIVWWSLMGGMSFSAMKSAKIELKNDYGRISKALKYLNKEYNWDKDVFLDRLDIQINKRVSIELSELCKIKGIGKTHATELFEMGIENLEDIEERWDEIENFCSEELVKILRENNHGLKLS